MGDEKMIIFKSLYSEALVGFPYNENSIFTITTEETKENNIYSSLEWNVKYFFALLLNEVPRAVNLLFIPPNYWIIPDSDNSKRIQIEFWERLRTNRGAFVTRKYAETANDTINMFIDGCIRNKVTASNSTMLDLARILYYQEILMSVINIRHINYPLGIIEKEINSCKNKTELISKVIGRQNIVDNVIKDKTILKYVSGFTKNQINILKKEVNAYDR